MQDSKDIVRFEKEYDSKNAIPGFSTDKKFKDLKSKRIVSLERLIKLKNKIIRDLRERIVGILKELEKQAKTVSTNVKDIPGMKYK